nr:PP2C family protein-serine/threonine phosphatase [Streptomyces sp. HNM0574]
MRRISDLLAAQRRHVRRFTARHRAWAETFPAGGEELPDIRELPAPDAQAVLDAVPLAAMLLAPLHGPDGAVRDFRYVTHNVAAGEYAARYLGSVVSPWPGRVPILRYYPHMSETAVPGMLAEVLRTGRSQGPVPAEWYVRDADGRPVRVSNEVRAARCGELALLSWERGERSRMALAAQRLARVCWAEWNLADDEVITSTGLGLVLGLPEQEAKPRLMELARMTAPEYLGALEEVLRAALVLGKEATCDLRFTHAPERMLRLVAEPVRIMDGPVWTVRAVLRDVSEVGRSREMAERARREARRQQDRAEAVAEIAERLREAVLPGFPADTARQGLESAAVYRPDAGEAGVGGDWYKTRMLPDGRVLVALGDARGHGLDAVALMAKLRYALAGLAYTGAVVERLTAWLNELACDDGRESTTTAIIARYHPERCLLRWTCAGHPRPVLVRDGQALLLPGAVGGPGLPLGVLPHATYTATETWLRGGDVLLLYSDGLIEHRGEDLDVGIAALRAAAERRAGSLAPGPEALQTYTDAVVSDLTGPTQMDDATVLTFRALGA